MNFALYIISAAISIRLYLYIVSKNLISSSLLVVTEVEGGSILCAEYGRTCGVYSSASHRCLLVILVACSIRKTWCIPQL